MLFEKLTISFFKYFQYLALHPRLDGEFAHIATVWSNRYRYCLQQVYMLKYLSTPNFFGWCIIAHRYFISQMMIKKVITVFGIDQHLASFGDNVVVSESKCLLGCLFSRLWELGLWRRGFRLYGDLFRVGDYRIWDILRLLLWVNIFWWLLLRVVALLLRKIVRLLWIVVLLREAVLNWSIWLSLIPSGVFLMLLMLWVATCWIYPHWLRRVFTCLHNVLHTTHCNDNIEVVWLGFK